MRDILILAIILGMIPFAFRRPQIGVLTWVWLSVMNPHREAYGFIFSFPVVDIVAAVTLLSLMINWKSLPKVGLNGLIFLLGTYFIWTTLTTIFAVEPALAYEKWSRFGKTLLLFGAILSSMNNRTWTIALVWVFLLSVAYTGIKGGVFVILTGGAARVWGPYGSQWYANNAVTFVLLMSIPIILALRRSTNSKYLSWGLAGAAFLFLCSVLGTQSRGGLVALCAVLLAFGLRSKYKLPAFAFGTLLLAAVFTFMPQSWQHRMGTIINYEGDTSATNRIVQWRYAIDIAGERPLFASGFDAAFHAPYANRYLFDDDVRAVHSSYFEVLGEQGYIGLIMFLLILFTAIRYSNRLRKVVVGDPDKEVLRLLGTATQYSFIAYAANGLTVNIATIDIYYLTVAILLLCNDQVGVNPEMSRTGRHQSAIARKPAGNGSKMLGPRGVT